MKHFICSIILLGTMLAISPIMGCGSSEDKPKKVIDGSDATQKDIEQKAEQITRNDITTSEKTEKAKMTEEQPVMENSPEKDNMSVSQIKESTDVTETDVQDVIDVIIIENQGYTTDKKGSVEFSHLKHSEEYGISCIQCHHLYEDGVNLWKKGDHVDKCVVCHDPAVEKDDVMKLQNAFHQNCRDCHKAMSEEGKEAPYKRCSDCHG